MNIFDDATDAAPPKVSGQWMPIRLAPDLITGEIFNIGVVFVDETGGAHHRMLESAHVFRCAFGERAADNMAFLLRLAREHFFAQLPGSPSPHITLGRPAPASGETHQEILDRLFDAMVSLIPEQEEDQAVIKSSTVPTDKLRQKVFGRLKTDYRHQYNRIYRDEPVVLSDDSGNRHKLDLPLWDNMSELLLEKVRFGTIVSAQFKDRVHRHYNIGSATNSIVEASALLGSDAADAGIFILRPHDDTADYSKGLLAQIDDDIDKFIWTMRLNAPRTTTEVCYTVEDLAQKVAKFAEPA